MPNSANRVKLIVSHALTYTIIAQTVLTAVLANGTLDRFPSGARYGAVALSGLAAIVAVLRKEEAWGQPPT